MPCGQMLFRVIKNVLEESCIFSEDLLSQRFEFQFKAMLNPQVLRGQEILIFKTLSLSIANHNTMEAYDGAEVQLHAFLTSNWIT